MKKVTLLAATALFTFAMTACGGGETKKAEEVKAAPVEAEAKTITVDAATSTVEWEGNMVGMYAHSGTVVLKEGSLEWKGNDLVGGNFVIDMTSINPTDSNYSEEHTAEQLIGHLGTADFFDVANNPTASFEITGSDMTTGTVSGNLTVRGKTNPATINNVKFDDGSGTAMGTLTFDRQQYGVAYKSTMKDMVLSDDITLNITLKPAA